MGYLFINNNLANLKETKTNPERFSNASFVLKLNECITFTLSGDFDVDILLVIVDKGIRLGFIR